MERVYFIQKSDVIDCMENGFRVYYTEKGSTDIFELDEKDSLASIKNADYFIAVKKG